MGVEYSKNTLINIYKDTIVSYGGSYTQSNEKLQINKNSWVSFVKDIDSGENGIKTDSLNVEIDIKASGSDISSRYNSKIKVNIKIQYYAEIPNDNGTVDYTPGLCETICITPYLSNETDGKINSYPIETKNMPIKRLEVYIYNATDSQSVNINNFGIYNSLNLTESLSGSLAIECTLTEVQNWNTGLRVKFTTGDLDLKTLKNTDTGKFAGYNVNDKLVVKWTDVNADL
jgi:hypothetical protein